MLPISVERVKPAVEAVYLTCHIILALQLPPFRGSRLI